MHLQRVAIFAAVALAGCSSSDATTTTQGDDHGCAAGAVYCTDCNGGGFCSSGGGCPNIRCFTPVPDSGRTDDAASSDAMIVEASAGGDAATSSDASPRACGDQTCGGNQLCVHPTCAGGVPTPCSPTNDAGTCPSGWTYQPLCQQFGGGAPMAGCLPPRCTDPPAFCIDIPAACGATPMCGCLPADVCKGHGQCGFINKGSDVLCLSA